MKFLMNNSDENPHDEMLRESTRVSQRIASKTTKSDITQQASSSTIPKSRTTRSGRQNIPDKKLDLWNEIWMDNLSANFVLLKLL